MARLRVAVVSDATYPWHKGGKEVRYLHLLSALPECDIDVVVYTMKWWDVVPKVVRTESGSLTYVAICPRIEMYKDKRRSITQALVFAASTCRLLTRQFDVIRLTTCRTSSCCHYVLSRGLREFHLSLRGTKSGEEKAGFLT